MGDKVKGIVYIEDENGKQTKQTRYIYEKMLKAGRKIMLIAEANTNAELEKELDLIKRGD